MKYSFDLYNIVDNLIQEKYKTYNYDSDIFYWANQKDFIEEVLNKYKDKTIGQLVLDNVSQTDIALRREFGSDIPEQYKALYNDAIKGWDDFNKSLIGGQEYCKLSFKTIIRDIKDAHIAAKKYELLDSQEYLNFQDELNKLSLDENRPDTV